MVQPTKQPTPMEWQIIAYVLISGLALLGVILFWASARLAPEKPEVAKEVFQMGWYCMGGSVLALLLWQGIKRMF